MKLKTRTNKEIEVKRHPFAGRHPEMRIPGFCSGCNCSHDLPARDWFLVKWIGSNFQLTCGPSLGDIIAQETLDAYRSG